VTNTLVVQCTGWSDADGDAEGYRYQWQTNGNAVAGAPAGARSACFRVGDSVTCLVTAWDGAAAGTCLETAPRVIASRQPTVSITAPANGTAFVTPASIAVSAVATNADGLVTQVTFFVDGTPLAAPDTTPPFGVVWANAATGTHHLTAQVRDVFGNVATSLSCAVTVAIPSRVIQLQGDLAFGGVPVGQVSQPSCRSPTSGILL